MTALHIQLLVFWFSILPASSENGYDCTWSNVLQWGGRGCNLSVQSPLRVPAGNLTVNGVNWYSDELSKLPYSLPSRFWGELRICVVSSGSVVKVFVTAPSHSTTWTTLGAFREELHSFITYFILRVCVHEVLHEILWMSVFQHHVLGFGLFFFFCLIYTNFSCLCMLPLTCCPHLSQMLSLKEVSSLFWPHHYKPWIHFTCSKLKSIVLIASIFQGFSAQFSSVLPSLLFFLSFIAFLWLEQLSW